MVPVHVPARPPEPLTIGELISLAHVLLAMVEPESYSTATKADQKMTKEAITYRNALVPRLIEGMKALQLWTGGGERSRDRSQSSSTTRRYALLSPLPIDTCGSSLKRLNIVVRKRSACVVVTAQTLEQFFEFTKTDIR
eukprot:6484943-Amphidinium_carterae.2